MADVQKRMISLFQSASGAWHWPSILTVLGWLVGFLVAGGFMFANLVVNRDDRLKAFVVIKATEDKLADAIKAAAEAKTTAQRLAEQQVPRSLTKEQHHKVQEYLLNKTKGPISIYQMVGDSEATKFAGDIKIALIENGFTVTEQTMLGGFINPGIHLVVSDINSAPNYTGNVQGALESIGFATTASADPKLPATEVRLYIGPKPR